MEMINLITIVIFLLVLMFVCKRKDFASPLFAFCMIWFIVLSFYSIRLYGIYLISTDTAWLLLAGSVSFVLGFICMNKIKIRVNKATHKTNWGLLNVICIIMIVVSFPYYSSSLINMMKSGGDVAAYKLLLVTGEVDNGGVVMQYVVRPFEFLIMGMSAYVFSKSIKQYIVFFSGIYFCVVRFFTTGSKTAFLYLGLSFVFAILNNKNRKRSFYNYEKVGLKKKLMIGGIGGSFFIAVYSVSGNFFKSIYTYVTGCVPMLDKILHDSFYYDEYMGGLVSFNGIVRFFVNLAELVGLPHNTNRFDEASNIIARFEYTINISDEIRYNAFATYISYFYIDFGGIGVIFCSFLFGVVICYVYRKYKQEQSVVRFAQLAVIYYMVTFSIVRFQLSHTVIAMSFIYSMVMIVIQNLKFKISLRK